MICFLILRGWGNVKSDYSCQGLRVGGNVKSDYSSQGLRVGGKEQGIFHGKGGRGGWLKSNFARRGGEGGSRPPA